MGCCERSRLCDRCYEQSLVNLSGVAMSRGMAWADRVARMGIDRSQPWPAHEGRAARIARRLVGGIASDERLLEELATACAKEAARWWGRLQR